MMAPTDRNINTSVMPQVISEVVLSNSSPSWEMVKDTVKKSKASQDQAMKAQRKKSHCCRFSSAKVLNGLGALAIGGFNVGSLVAKYRPIPMRDSGGASALGEYSRSLPLPDEAMAIHDLAKKRRQRLKIKNPTYMASGRQYIKHPKH